MKDFKEYTQEEYENCYRERLENCIEQNREGKFFMPLVPEFKSANKEDNTVVVRFYVEPAAMNPMGILHGGATATLFDTVGGILVHLIGDTHMVTTTNININYIKAIQIEQMIDVKIQIVHMGKTLAHAVGEIWTNDGKTLAANANMTFMLLHRSLKKEQDGGSKE